MQKKITFRDETGREHIVCEGNCCNGEIIFSPTKRDMLRVFLTENQPASFRKRVNQRDWLVIIRWDGKDFRTTSRVA